MDPSMAVAYKNRGDLYETLNEYEKAIQDYNKSIEKDPNASSTWNNRGFVYKKMGKYQEGNLHHFRFFFHIN